MNAARPTTRLTQRADAAARRWAADERGAAVVEFAVVVPVLLVLVMAIIDFGRLFAVAASLSAAVRDGARTAAAACDIDTNAQRRAAIQVRVRDSFETFGGRGLTAAAVNVAFDGGGENVVVGVTGYEYTPITPVARLVGLGTIRLDRAATFRWEFAQ